MHDNWWSVMDWVNGLSLQLVLCVETDLYVQEPTYTWSFWHAFLKGQVRVWKAITYMPLHCNCPPATHPCVCCIIYLTGRSCLLPCLFPVVIFSSFRPVSRWVLTALICETIGEHCTPWRGANYCRKDFCSRYFNSCFLLPSSGSKWRAPLSRTPQHILGKSVKAETRCKGLFDFDFSSV